MRVDIGCDHTRNPCGLGSDKFQNGSDLSARSPALTSRAASVEKIRVGIGCVDLGRIVRHEITLVI